LFALPVTVAQNTPMIKAAASAPSAEDSPRLWEFEQPLSERMRTFMRLEFLYQQMLYNSESESDWASRAAVASLLDIMSILTRGDMRGDIMKELDRQLDVLRRFQEQPDVDPGRLDSLIRNFTAIRQELQGVGMNYLQPIKDSEFLSAIKHRSSIPGGTCEFDLPAYSHWLRQPFDKRRTDLLRWLALIRPVCDAVVELLWLIRECAQPTRRLAIGGMYQHTMPKDNGCQLIRVSLAPGAPFFPEISGNQHRFTVRFLEWSSIDSRATQTSHDVSFRLSLC